MSSACVLPYRPVTVEQARQNQALLCRKLDRWQVSYLADGGSMDGKGYGCKIRGIEERDSLDSILCLKNSQPTSP